MWYRVLPLLLCGQLVFAAPLHARDFADPLAQRVTEFLPAYNPFVPPLPPERYFPDEVGGQVADAIIDGYLQDPSALRGRIVQLAQQDAQRQAQGEEATGVTPLVYALLYRSIEQAEQEDLPLMELNAMPDELLSQADHLYASEKRRRVARLFNWVLSTFDVARLFLGAPASPSPYAAQGVVSSVGQHSGPGPRERKALALYQRFLEQAPHDPRAPEVRARMEALDTKRKEALVKAELARAKQAFAEEDYWQANFHYQLALLVDENAEKAKAGVQQVESRLQHYDALIQYDSEAPQDPLAGVKQAEWEHSKETLTYMLPGGGFVKDNIVVAGLQLGTEGLVGAATFGGLTMIQTLGKLWQVMTGRAVSQQGIITEGEKYVQQTPLEERSPEIYPILAKAYAKEGRTEKAIEYYALAGMEEEIPKLQENAAAALLEQAKASPHQTDKQAYLRRLLENYPKTEAVKEAAKEFEQVSRPENQGLQLSKMFLRDNPDLFGAQGLGLKRELYDGNWRNVELTDDGIILSPHGDITLLLESDTGPRPKVYGVPTASWQQFWRKFREKGYEDARYRGDREIAKLVQGAEPADITLKSQFEKNDADGWRILPYLTGSLGEGFDVRGTLPRDILGTRLAFGRDQFSSYVGLEVPMPLVPVDFLLLGRDGLPSLYPRIRLPGQTVTHEELYR